MIWIVAKTSADHDSIVIRTFETDERGMRQKMLQMAREEAEARCADEDLPFEELIDYCPEKEKDVVICRANGSVNLCTSVIFTDCTAQVCICASPAGKANMDDWVWVFFDSDDADMVFGNEGPLPAGDVRKFLASMMRGLRYEDESFDFGTTNAKSIIRDGTVLQGEACFSNHHCMVCAVRKIDILPLR